MNKIGARVLTDNECKLILPTFEKIFKQIDAVRQESAEIVKLGQLESNKNISADKELDQKTNNIGILGCRGGGKTSLLKTIREKIKHMEKNETGDVVLPIIIPENMSSNSTLIATILGMFSTIVEQRHKTFIDEKNDQLYACEKEDLLIKKYNEVIKQYTYIQKEYRDILLNQFTSENDYVKQSAKVFNSDTEFIRKFNDFINELLGIVDGRQEALLFIFIDDIDLSTYRCSDVVKTLLSYLSNPRIVTFISGDLETFEEALILDFLRLEKALDQSVFEKSYLGGEDKKLLYRKKTLAYEYLKKIMPPVLRHSIKRWTLQERGNYTIDLNNSRIPLSSLLCSCLKKYIQPSYFKYIKIDSGDENTIKEYNLSYTYNLFDYTSRGLNNVYNVLLEINGRKDVSDDIDISDRKLLIETIVASNPTYNEKRELIFNSIIILGSTEEETRIEFENARQIIVPLCESVYDIDKEKAFQLFVLVDFAHRLLSHNISINTNENYNSMKLKILYLLMSSAIVSKKVCSDRFKENVLYDHKKNIYESSDLNYISGMLKDNFINFRNHIDNRKHSFTDDEMLEIYNTLNLKDFIIRIFFYSKLEIGLFLFDNFAMEKIVDLFDIEKNFNDNKLQKSIFEYFYYALYSYSYLADNKNSLILLQENIKDMYEDFADVFNYIQNNVSKSVDKNLLSIILGPLVDMNSIDIREKRLLFNTIYVLLTDLINTDLNRKNRIELFINEIYKKNELKSIFEKIPYVKIMKDDNVIISDLTKEENLKFEERKLIIEIIDQKNMWNMDYCNNVKQYIVNQINGLFKAYDLNIINLNNFKDSYFRFSKIYKGSSWTKADQLQSLSREYGIAYGSEVEEKIDIENYNKFYNACTSLASNYRVWYGQYEAREMLNALNECNFDYSNIPSIKYIQFLICYYMSYKLQEFNLIEVSKQAKVITNFTRLLSKSHEQADREVLSSFLEELNCGLGEGYEITGKKMSILFKQ